MADEDMTSPEWSKEAVIRQLRRKAADGRSVRAQVFLKDDVSSGQLRDVVEQNVEDAKSQVGQSGTSATVGKIHNLAKSFSIDATPDVVEAIAAMPSVKSILPSEISDIYPRPVKD